MTNFATLKTKLRMMKKLLVTLFICLPLMAGAQNTWEKNEPVKAAERQAKTAVDSKYLAGAVPEVDGKVEFSTTIEAPGKSAQQIYDIIGRELSHMAKEKNQYEKSRILLADTATHQISATFEEQMIFKSTALALDYTRFSYYLTATCTDGQATLKINRIHYLYEEEREPQTYVAEEWITDKEGLNKKGDKLARISGKFRRATIDRKDFIFARIKARLLQ